MNKFVYKINDKNNKKYCLWLFLRKFMNFEFLKYIIRNSKFVIRN